MAILGNPFVANVQKEMSNEELAQALRLDIAGEFEAIIGYEAHAMSINDERVKKVLHHIADEERKHVGQKHAQWFPPFFLSNLNKWYEYK